MSKGAETTYTAFRYMTRFRCRWSECESSCCTGGWGIAVDREHYEKAKEAMGGSRVERQEFAARVQRVKPQTRSNAHHALLVLQSNGDCSFLNEQRLCGLQSRYGEAVLSNTCTVYPRTMAKSGARYELAGLPSCPEVSRQLLLEPDAMELVEVPAEAFARSIFHVKVEEHPEDPYLRYHDELRNLILDLLSAQDQPLAIRLATVAYFANRTVEFLYRGAPALDESRLLAEVERILNPEFRAGLAQELARLPVDASFPSRVVVALVSGRVQVDGFRQLLDAVIQQYSSKASLMPANDGAEAVVQQIVRAYGRHKSVWSRFQTRIDGYLENYAKNYWVREWYAESPNLLMHTVQLLVRMVVLRFLLFGHPLLAAAIDQSEPEQERALDRAVVECVQTFSRAFEHQAAFTKKLQERLTSSNLISLAHATCLAKF